MTTTREHEQRHRDALGILAAHEAEVATAAGAGTPLPDWAAPVLTEVRRLVERHAPVVLRDLEGETGPVRCAGHRPPRVPRHLLTVVDHPEYPCADVAHPLVMLVGPEPAPEVPAASASSGIHRAPTTWSSTR